MYNVAWGPKRIVNKTRRDITQKLEKLDQIRELTRKSSGSSNDSPTEIMSSPKPTFQPIGNRNRTSNGRHHHQEPMSPQHQELVKFFNDSWENVCKEMEKSRQNGQDTRGGAGSGILFYKSTTCHPDLANFKPFDLESYWGNKVYTKTTQSR